MSLRDRLSALWARVPIRLRAGSGVILLLCALLGLWAATGWALPTRELVLRTVEAQHAFGPGELVAGGDLAFRWNLPYDNAPDAWLVSRSGDRFLPVVLDRRPWPLWRVSDFLPRPTDPLCPTEEAPLVWRCLADFRTNYQEEVTPGRESYEYLLAVCAADPAFAAVEVSMDWEYRVQDASGDYGERQYTDPVTVSAQPEGPGVWTARLLVPYPFTGLGSAGGWYRVRLQGYGADGGLLYDSGWS